MLISIEQSSELTTLGMSGSLSIGDATALAKELAAIPVKPKQYLVIDGHGVASIDSAIALVLKKQMYRWQSQGCHVALKSFNQQATDIMAFVDKHSQYRMPPKVVRPSMISVLEDIGVATEKIIKNFTHLIAFSGLVVERLLLALRHPSRLRVTPLVAQLDQIGFRALAIVGLITFLIGAVIVNQGAFYLRQVGADVFTVDLLSITMLREFGILLTAVIVAGRSGSAFTAQIGSMQLNEEIDAMKTLGMNPIDVLVLPRILALVLIMPLLAFYADLMGLLGGALTAWVTLEVSPVAFIQRFEEAVTVSSFYVGILKAPFFGIMIGLSGCYEGMCVRGSAEKLGFHTTRSVVQSIFLVIVMDAAFAMIFTALDI